MPAASRRARWRACLRRGRVWSGGWWPRRAVRPMRWRCGCGIMMPSSTRREHRSGRQRCGGGVRCAGNGAGRSAWRAGDGRRARQSRRADRSAGAGGRDRPRAHRRRSAAGDRGRPDRAAAADRCGTARRRRGPGSSWSRQWIEDKAGGRTRRARADDRRPGGVRRVSRAAARGSRPRRCRRTAPTSSPSKAATKSRARIRAPTTAMTAKRWRRQRRRNGNARRRNPNADEGEDDTQADERVRRRRGRATSGDEGSESQFPRRSRRNWPDEPVTDYRAFTTRHDEMIEAAELCDEEELTRLRAYLDQQMAPRQGSSPGSPTACNGG